MQHIHWLKLSPLSNLSQRSGSFSDPYLLWRALSHIFDCIIPLLDLPKPPTDLYLQKGKATNVESSADTYRRTIVDYELCRLLAQTSTTDSEISAPEMMACLSSLFALARSVLVDVQECMKKLATAKSSLAELAGFENGFRIQVPVMGVVLETVRLYEPETVMLQDIIKTLGEVFRELETELYIWEEWWEWTAVETEFAETSEESPPSARVIISGEDVEYNWEKDWEMAVKYSNCFDFIRRIASNRHRDLVPILDGIPHMPSSPLGPGITPPEVDIQAARPSLKRRRMIKWNRPADLKPAEFDRHGQVDLPGVPIQIRRTGRN